MTDEQAPDKPDGKGALIKFRRAEQELLLADGMIRGLREIAAEKTVELQVANLSYELANEALKEQGETLKKLQEAVTELKGKVGNSLYFPEWCEEVTREDFDEAARGAGLDYTFDRDDEGRMKLQFMFEADNPPKLMAEALDEAGLVIATPEGKLKFVERPEETPEPEEDNGEAVEVYVIAHPKTGLPVEVEVDMPISQDTPNGSRRHGKVAKRKDWQTVNGRAWVDDPKALPVWVAVQHAGRNASQLQDWPITRSTAIYRERGVTGPDSQVNHTENVFHDEQVDDTE